MIQSRIYKQTLKKELKDKTILITGGAGSIGSHLTKKILEYPVKVVRVLDIDEHALFQLKHSTNDPRLRCLLGNILNDDRIEMAMNGVDIVIHTAAIKNLEISEFNPIETIETNINGTVNLIKIIMKLKPTKFINISTDKAAEPSTLYGTTKQLSERLTSWAGKHITTTKFSSVRLGNVFETRGNVLETWSKQHTKKEPLSITHPAMKRYYFHVDEAIDFILECISLTNRGEIFIPKMKLYDMKNIANHISKNHKIIGMRQGEKLKEVLITDEEKKMSEKRDNMWILKYYTMKNKIY